jgi:hypothetical protein
MAAKHHDRRGGMAVISHESTVGEQVLHSVGQKEGNVIHEAFDNFPKKGFVTSGHR